MQIFDKMTRIYLDNAATTPLCKDAMDAMTFAMKEIYGNPSSIHSEGRIARTVIENARKTIAKGLNASVAEIFFTSGSTEATNMMFAGAIHNLGVKRIITSPVEHHCVLIPLEHIDSQDIEILKLPVNKYGLVDLGILENLLQSSNVPTLVSLMHANNELSSLHDIERISSICQANNAYFHCDTTQTMAHIPLDVQKIKLHFLSGSAHKFYGPKGAGFIYINADVQIDPFITGGSQERNMRAGTENIIGIAGMAAAFDFTLKNAESSNVKMSFLHNYLKTEIAENIPNIYFHGDPLQFFPKILSVSFPPSPKNEMLLMNLDINGIAASGGSACSSGVEHQSGVLDYILEPEDRKTVRFSFSYINEIEELDKVVSVLKSLFPTE